MSIKKIIITRLVFAVMCFCGAAGTAWYVSHNLTHKQSAKSVAPDVTKLRRDPFADKLSGKLVSVARRSSQSPMPVIFDNDAASDDAMAFVVIGNDPRVAIKAVTVEGTGEAHAEVGAKNMSDIAYLLGKPDLPIAYGRSTPLTSAGKAFPGYLRKFVDEMLIGKNVPHHPNPAISNNAVETMRQALEISQDKVAILATGPLTNVAELMTKYPKLNNRIKKIVIMGGAVYVPGNQMALHPEAGNTVSESNFYADPEAVRIVFASKVPITLVSLDATNQVPMTKEFYQSISGDNEPDIKLVHSLLKDFVDQFGMKRFTTVFYMWDPLAAMVLLDPQIAEIKSIPVLVNADNGQIKPAKAGDKNAMKISLVTKIHDPDAVTGNYLATIKSNHIYAQQRFHDAVWRNTADATRINKSKVMTAYAPRTSY